MKLILIRHGLPVRSDSSADPSLAPQGVRQAEQMARWLHDEGIDALYSSPMRRARETAEPLAALTGLTPRVIEGIAEYDQGSGRYVPMEELKRTDYAAWQAVVAGGGVDDIAAFRERVVTALLAVTAEHRGGTVAVCCHGGVINVWSGHVLGLAPRLFFEPHYASIHRFLCSSAGHLTGGSLNETAHRQLD